jgi:hypothetical protein
VADQFEAVDRRGFIAGQPATGEDAPDGACHQRGETGRRTIDLASRCPEAAAAAVSVSRSV